MRGYFFQELDSRDPIMLTTDPCCVRCRDDMYLNKELYFKQYKGRGGCVDFFHRKRGWTGGPVKGCPHCLIEHQVINIVDHYELMERFTISLSPGPDRDRILRTMEDWV
jgi:hypothetical protein